MRRNVAAIAAVTLALMVGPGLAEERMEMDHSHGHAHHGQMKAVDVKPGTEAAGVGTLNSVDTEKNMVNLTHEPMPELGWPVMTMDLPVTKRVDLGSVKVGERIDFKVKLGRDKKYRVIEMTPTK
ncbi:MAG: copper-binding protein [Filomicrobium sp.]